jgi:hypothetical protein
MKTFRSSYTKKIRNGGATKTVHVKSTYVKPPQKRIFSSKKK